MKRKTTILLTLGVLGVFVAGYMLSFMACATHIREAKPRTPAKVKLGTYQQVYMVNTTIDPKFAKSGENQRATKKINEDLIACMKKIYPGLQVVDSPNVSVEPGAQGMVIMPNVIQIKFISAAGRVMVGAAAGNSGVLMQVIYKDLATGNVVADPEFFARANAMGGAYSFGVTDNMMLLRIAEDICQYTKENY